MSAALQDVIFASDADFPEPPPANYAMPFFAGLGVECAVFAMLGIQPVSVLATTELWTLAGVFGALAVLTSPVARAATEPLDQELRSRLRRLARRA